MNFVFQFTNSVYDPNYTNTPPLPKGMYIFIYTQKVYITVSFTEMNLSFIIKFVFLIYNRMF